MFNRSLKKTICAWIAILAIVCCTRPFQAVAAGTSYQICKTAANCTVGEYLYDDAYTPITSATCTLSSRNPDGTLYHSSVSMTSAAENDGWYSYTFDTTGKAEGIYRSQVCCTSGSDYLCLDKTFQISSTSAPTAAEVASTVWDTSAASHATAGSFGANLQSAAPTTSDIWNYSDRSLTTYGSLIADMWSYSGRSLTNFGTLIADIWSNATRTLTAGILSNGTHIATQEDVQLATDSAVVSIKGASNKDLTQVGTQVAGVQSTADTINGKVDSLTTTVATINTNVSTLLSKWSTYSASDLITAIGAIQTDLGTSSDTCSQNTVFGNAYCAKNKWGAESGSSLLTATNAVATTANALRTELAYNGKSTTAYEDLQTLISNLSTVTTKVDSVATQVTGVQTTANTINGKVDTLTTSVGTLNTNISTIVAKWGSYSAADILTAVTGVSTTIGTTLDTCSDNTVFGNAYCAKSKWGLETATTLLTATNNVATTAAALRAELAYNGKSTTAYEDMQTLLANLSTVSSGVGSVTTAISGVDTKVDAVALQVLGVQTTSNTINGKVDTLITTTNTINTTTSTGSAALATINAKLDSLGTKVDTLTTNVTTLLDKWGAYSASDIVTIVSSLQTSIGTNSDNCLSTSLFGYARCAKEKWGTATADDLLTATTTVGTTATALRNELAYNGKSTTAYEDLQTLLANLSSVSTNVNTVHSQVTGIDTKMDTVTADVLGISTQVSTVSAKIDVLTTKVDNLATAVGGMQTNVTSLVAKWSTYTMSDVITKLTSLETSLGSSANTCVDLTVFGYLTCVENNGGGGGGGNDAAILAAATAAAADAAALRTELDYNGKSTTAYADLQNLKSNITTMQTLIGGSNDASSASTLFGRIKDVRETIATLDTSGAGLSDLLAKWGDTSATEIYSKVKDLSEKIDAVNTVSDVASILTLSKTNADDMLVLKNKILELRALTQLNKALLQDGTAKPVVQLWMEEGSIIFKTLITNPSSTTQSVPVKFYLPKEASEKDIMKIDDDLKAHYDPDQDAVYVGGNFTLASHQTKIVSIEVTDIWKVTDAEIASLRTQSEELFKPLEKTSYFAQGSTLKSDITAALDTAKQVQADAKTPEARIKAYRDATSQVKRAKEDMAGLKTLVTQAGSAGSLLGSVGGIQTVGTWGLIIILTTGFIFLAFYMRVLTQQMQSNHTPTEKSAESSPKPENIVHKKLSIPIASLPKETRLIGALILAIIVAGLAIVLVAKSHFLQSLRPQSREPKVEGTEKKIAPSESPAARATESQVRLVRALEKYEDAVNLREGPGKEFEVVGTMKKGKSYQVIDTLTDKSKTVWLELAHEEAKKAWVSSAFVEDVIQTSSASNDVVVKDQKQVLGIQTEEPSLLPGYTVNQDNVKLRMAPIPDSRFKMILSKGMHVTKIGEEKEWTNVEVSYQEGQSVVGIDGWVKTDFLDRIGL